MVSVFLEKNLPVILGLSLFCAFFSGSSTSAIVTNLDADALYFFKLRAVTGRGAGADSQVLRVQTRKSGLEGSPDNSHGAQQGWMLINC